PIGIEMPVDVDVRIDEPGHHRQAGQVVSRRCRTCADGTDARTLNLNIRVADRAAPPVEDRAGLKHDRLIAFADGIPVDFSAFHHEHDTAYGCYGGQWIAIDRDGIRLHASRSCCLLFGPLNAL